MISIKKWQCIGIVVMSLISFVAQAKPFTVISDVSIRHGNWYPLPVKEMKAAATDTALDVISDGGLLRIIKPDAGSANGILSLEVSLIGPAETAKLTIKLDLKDKPSYVATSSISVRQLDHQGIYKAFEHIGRTAGERMNNKIQALVIAPQPPLSASSQATGQSEVDNSQLRALYDKAQSEKRRFHYKRARILFEQVAAAPGSGSKRLRKLAKDELIYGLPVFEAKQWIVAMGKPFNSPQQIKQAQENATNLYRQILAENSDNYQRTLEAQRALDGLSVSQRALRNSMNASGLARVYHVRQMMQMEQMSSFSYGCLTEKSMHKIVKQSRSPMRLIKVKKTEYETSYILLDKESDAKFRLVCHRGDVTIDKTFQ